ncbi:MAG TPA: CPBP family glutamic-type intramembrane protease [Bacteroidota bacterium]|nr:CPBP family glutamic-type intramembrane protease [Bacteroidota bacterium]
MKETILQVFKQILALAAVGAIYVCVRRWDTLELIRSVSFIASSFSPVFVAILERHIWQFFFALIGLTVLSRGNLWSCGINSMNVRRSLLYLLGFYAVGTVTLAVFAASSVFMSVRYDLFPIADRLLVMTIHWLSSPVADQILFFGLFQTALLKAWDDKIKIFSEEIPSVILLTAMMFALGRTGLPHYASMNFEYVAGYGVGLFSGVVYYKTRSLLTPMLAQAFFFGMPDAIHIIAATIGHRL